MTTIKLRRGTASEWTTNNPILAAGEMGIETDTRKFKFGDGTTPWNTLAYASAEGGGGTGDVTAAGDNYFTGNNTFTGSNTFNDAVRVNGISSAQLFKVQLDESSNTYATYGYNFITLSVNNDNKGCQLQLPYKDGTFALTSDIPSAVSANPTLSGSETELAGLQIGSTKYKIVTQTYVDTAIGNIDTLLTALNSGTGV